MQISKLTPEVVKDKIVAVRVDYNVPIVDGKVSENMRIVESLPTLNFLVEHGAKQIHIISHLGRPKGERKPEFTLKPVADELSALWDQDIEFRDDYTAGDGFIQMHENARFYPGEKKNQSDLVEEMKQMGAEIFVLDGFAVAHRAQASVIGLADHMPAYPGFLLEKEIQALTPYLSRDKIPGLTVIVSGLKMETKVPVLKHFATIAENILVGGGIANTLAVAEGYDVGKSFFEEAWVETAREVLEIADKHNTGVHLPVDVVCGESVDSTQSVTVPLEDVIGDMMILDIGPHTVASYAEILQHSKEIIWNGPLGAFENPVFANGSEAIAKLVANQQQAKTLLGGGDTLEVLKKFNIDKSEFSHVSTGGGAMLEFLEGKELPGIAILKEN